MAHVNRTRQIITTLLTFLALLGLFSLRVLGLYSHQALAVVLLLGFVWAVASCSWLAWKGRLHVGLFRGFRGHEHRPQFLQAVARASFWAMTAAACLAVFPRSAELMPLIVGLAVVSVLRVAASFLVSRRTNPGPTIVMAAAALVLAFDLGRAFVGGGFGAGEADIVQIAPPFDGEWLVLQGGPSPLQSHHLSAYNQRFALDLVRLDNGSIFSDETGNASVHSWEQPLVSPADGTVVIARGNMEDSDGANFVTDRADAAGNVIVIELEGGHFVVLAHLRQGTLQVSEGDRVRRGDPLALVGNSGNTTMSHLHLQVQTHRDLWDPDNRSVPFAFGADGRVLARNDRVGGPTPDATPAPATVTLADSASVEIVRISNFHALDLPQLETRLIYSTAADLEFEHVVGAVFLPDSSLVVADRGSSQLIFFDRDGNVRARTGREGEGPGEYAWIARIGIGADGTLFVYDRRQRRFTFLDSQGSVTGVQSIVRSGEVQPLVRLQSGEFLALFEPRPPLPPGLQRGPVLLVHGDDSWEVLDTLGQWVGKERHLSPESGEIVVGFGATALFNGRGQHTVVGTNDSLDVTLYQGTAPLTRIRGGHSPRQVTAQEEEAWTELYLAMFPEGFRADRRRELQQSTVRETYPAFGALSVDADGRIWVGDFARLEELERRWTILGPDGRPVGAVTLPVFRPEWYRFREGLGAMGTGAVEVTTSLPKPRHELLDVTAGRIAILRRGEFAGEFVEVYEVEMPR